MIRAIIKYSDGYTIMRPLINYYGVTICRLHGIKRNGDRPVSIKIIGDAIYCIAYDIAVKTAKYAEKVKHGN